MQIRPGAPICLWQGLNSQSLSSFCPPAAQDEPAPFGSHADKETMGPFPARIAYGS